MNTTANRFKRNRRLLSAAAFTRVFEKAQRSRDRLFTVLCRENGEDHARLGLAISKKHCQRASGRNRIKRAVRESFRQQQDALAGLDIVVMNQPAAARTNNPQLFESLDGHWQRLREQGKTES